MVRIIPKISNIKVLLTVIKTVLCKTSNIRGLEHVMIVFETTSTYHFATGHEASLLRKYSLQESKKMFLNSLVKGHAFCLYLFLFAKIKTSTLFKDDPVSIII